jgi:hypothetical protein
MPGVEKKWKKSSALLLKIDLNRLMNNPSTEVGIVKKAKRF